MHPEQFIDDGLGSADAPSSRKITHMESQPAGK
jgi:hypothetical protein